VGREEGSGGIDAFTDGDLGAYVDTLRRRWRLVASAVLVALLIGGLYVRLTPPVYSATADVLVNPGALPGAAVPSGSVTGMQTEETIIGTGSVARPAARSIHWTGTIPLLLRHLSVTNPAGSLVLAITFSSTSPRSAVAGANAFANSYVAFRTAPQIRSTQVSMDQLQSQIDGLSAELRLVQGSLQRLRPNSGAEEAAVSRENALQSKLGVLRAQLQGAGSVPASVAVVSRPPRPQQPSSPRPVLDLALAVLVGLFLGVVAAFIWDRFGRQYRDRRALERLVGAPVLALEPPSGWWARGRFGRRHRGRLSEQGRSELRNAGLALRPLVDARPNGSTVFQVVAPTEGPDTRLVARSIAESLASTGLEVKLVSTTHERLALDGRVEPESSAPTRGRNAGSGLGPSAEGGPPSVIWAPGAVEDGTTRRMRAGLLDLRKTLDAAYPERQVAVVVETPPLLEWNRALVLANLVDSVLVVVDTHIPTRQLEDVGRLLERVEGTASGVLMAPHRRAWSWRRARRLAAVRMVAARRHPSRSASSNGHTEVESTAPFAPNGEAKDGGRTDSAPSPGRHRTAPTSSGRRS
jgi:capsular polysaccharide biosynthesis protein